MPRFVRLAVALLAAAFIAGCHSPTDPRDDQASQPHGRLAGVVTIGPNCPVEQIGNPCPTPPDAYRARKILVYDAGRTTLLHTVDIDSQGLYFVDLAPGRYTVDLQKSGIDRTADLPRTVDIHANTTTTVNVNIDTGIR